jgi:hypothetical protein
LDFRSTTQEGEVTIWDGDHAMVCYPKPFQSLPQLALIELRQAQSPTRPYSCSDLQIAQQTATYFTVLNHHGDKGPGSWATVKWRATGVLASAAGKEAPAGPAARDAKARQALFLARVQRAGAGIILNPNLPDNPVVSLDFHHSGATDADLEELRGFTRLRVLNLYGSKISDAGLRYLSSLTALQTLYLNDTAVSDAGLSQLQGLTELKVLGLNQTRVTDAGLASLKNLKNLNDLTLGGSQITDQGLVQLRSLRNLRHLLLSGTGVTRAGAAELKRALPEIQIISER